MTKLRDNLGWESLIPCPARIRTLTLAHGLRAPESDFRVMPPSAPCPMKSCFLGTILVGFVALDLMAGAALAQGKIDCGEAYKAFLDKIKRERNANMSGEKLIALNRKAQRIYDACQTGHLQDAKTLFQRLDEGKY